MKVFIGFAIFVCLAFPVFSQNQNSNADQFSALNDSIESSVSRSTTILAGYDSKLINDDNFKVYSSFKKRYEALVVALRETEVKMDLLFRTSDRADYLKKERDTYDGLLTQLKTVKDEYDSWLQTVQ